MKQFLLGLALIAAPAAWGYETFQTSDGTPLRWARGRFPVLYVINEAGTPEVTLDALRLAVDNSFATWEAVDTAEITFRSGTTAQTTTGHDGTNLIRWFETGYPFDTSTLAITVNTYNDVSGAILDADIFVNGANFTWAADGSPSAFDIQNVITHESGHFLGLNHSPVAASTMNATAGPGEISKRSLHADDIEGLTFLYPLRSEPALPDPGDVNGSGKVDGRDMILLALAFGSGAGDPRYLAKADFNQDGLVDGDDLAVLSANFGTLY